MSTTPDKLPDFFGFKFSKDDPFGWPLYDDVLDLNWDPPDREQLIKYLQTAPIGMVTSVMASGGIACPLCGKMLDRTSSAMRTDGVWMWFHTLDHYVEFHNVRLPDAMVANIRANDHCPPKLGAEG